MVSLPAASRRDPYASTEWSNCRKPPIDDAANGVSSAMAPRYAIGRAPDPSSKGASLGDVTANSVSGTAADHHRRRTGFADRRAHPRLVRHDGPRAADRRQGQRREQQADREQRRHREERGRAHAGPPNPGRVQPRRTCGSEAAPSTIASASTGGAVTGARSARNRSSSSAFRVARGSATVLDLQLVLQGAPRLRQPSFDRAFGPAEQPGDVGDRMVMEVVEHEDRPLVDREPLERPLEPLAAGDSFPEVALRTFAGP